MDKDNFQKDTTIDDALYEEAVKAIDSIEELEEKLKESKEINEKLQKDIEDLKSKIGSLENSLETANKEKEMLEAKLIESNKEKKKILAKGIAIVKFVMGKITKEEIDAEVEKLKERSEESLKDTLTDLVDEYEKMPQDIEKVESPVKEFTKDNKQKQISFDNKKEFEEYLKDFAYKIAAELK